MNKVLLVGNVTHPPELKNPRENMTVCTFSLATNKDVKGTERTSYHRCVAWNATAERLAQHAVKGARLFIEGELQTRKFEKDGHDVYVTEVIVNSFEFVGEGRGSEREARTDSAQRGTREVEFGTKRARQEPAQPKQARFDTRTTADDDIPF